jgi:hypothetical protein
MTVSTAPGRGWTATLRRQRARGVNGQPDVIYTSAFEIICRGCGDDPRWDFQDVPSRLQRLRGPYWLTTGVTEYQAHLAWHEAQPRTR